MDVPEVNSHHSGVRSLGAWGGSRVGALAWRISFVRGKRERERERERDAIVAVVDVSTIFEAYLHLDGSVPYTRKPVFPVRIYIYNRL